MEKTFQGVHYKLDCNKGLVFITNNRPKDGDIYSREILPFEVVLVASDFIKQQLSNGTVNKNFELE